MSVLSLAEVGNRWHSSLGSCDEKWYNEEYVKNLEAEFFTAKKAWEQQMQYLKEDIEKLEVDRDEWRKSALNYADNRVPPLTEKIETLGEQIAKLKTKIMELYDLLLPDYSGGTQRKFISVFGESVVLEK